MYFQFLLCFIQRPFCVVCFRKRFLYAGAFDLSGPPYKCASRDNSQLWPQDGSDVKDG